MTAPPGPHLYLALASLSVRDFLADAIPNDPQPTGEPAKILMSYWYFRPGGDACRSPGTPPGEVERTYQMFDPAPMLFADSGAFSAGVSGQSIDLAEYVAWLRDTRGCWTVISNLDVVDYRTKWANSAADAKATWDNQRRMEDEFQIPVTPVFHTGEPWEYLERYCDTHPYVALGGMYGTRQVVWKWLVRCFQIAEQTGTRFHGFGMAKQAVLNSLPWYSFDNSSWASGQRFGGIPLFDGRKIVHVRVGDHTGVYARAALLRAHGYDPALIADRDRYHQEYAIGCGARAWRRYEHWLRARHEKVTLRCPAQLP